MLSPDSDSKDGDGPQNAAGSRGKRGHGRRSAAQRERAIVALLVEPTIVAAAEACGVHERTLREWLRTDGEFSAQLADARRQAFDAGMQKAQGLTSLAIDTLADLLGGSTPAPVRLGAARSLVEIGIHHVEAGEILKKLDAIEALHREAESQ